jgi:hypothetical protein
MVKVGTNNAMPHELEHFSSIVAGMAEKKTPDGFLWFGGALRWQGG